MKIIVIINPKHASCVLLNIISIINNNLPIIVLLNIAIVGDCVNNNNIKVAKQ